MHANDIIKGNRLFLAPMSFLLTGAAFFAVLFFGAVIQGATGFGLAIFSMSILPFFLPVKSAVVAMLPASITMFVIILIKQRRFIHYRLLLGLLPGIFAGRWLGTWGVTVLPDEIMRMVLGGMLILLALYFLFFRERIRPAASPVTASIAGGLSGLFGGLANIGGPPLVLYLFNALEEKRAYQGTISAAFLVAALFSILLHGLYGNIGPAELKLSLFGVAAALTGTRLGLLVFHRISRKTLSLFIVLLTAASGISMVLV